MERPSHPQQKFFKQHPHTPPPPRSCLKKHRENLVAEKENRKLGGGGGGWGVGKVFKRSQSGVDEITGEGGHSSSSVVSRLHTRQYHPITWGQLQYHTALLPLLLSSYFPFHLIVFSIVLQKFFLPCVKYSFMADINSWLRTCWVFNVKPPRGHKTFEQKKFLTEILMILKYQKMTP